MKMIPKSQREPGKPIVRSEGKLLEVIPIIEDGTGVPMMLPPAIWPVENWVLGYTDDHTIHTPIQFWQNARTVIPGSSNAANHRVTFLVRVLEAGEAPTPSTGTIDVDAVRGLLAAVRLAPVVYQAD